MEKFIKCFVFVLMFLCLGCFTPSTCNTSGENHAEANKIYQEFKKKESKLTFEEKIGLRSEIRSWINKEEELQKTGVNLETDNIKNMSLMADEICMSIKVPEPPSCLGGRSHWDEYPPCPNANVKEHEELERYIEIYEYHYHCYRDTASYRF